MKNNLLAQEKNKEKFITFTVPIEKDVTRIDKNGEETTKNISYMSQFIVVQDLWQTHYQVFSITKSNVNKETIFKNVKLAKLNINIPTVFLITQNLKMI